MERRGKSIAKPDPQVFEYALSLAGIQPHQAWYLGDQIDIDIQPARALGMNTIYVDYYGKGGGEMADWSVPSLSVAAWLLEENAQKTSTSGGGGEE